MSDEKSREEQIAAIEAQMVGLSPDDALKKASELASAKPAPAATVGSAPPPVPIPAPEKSFADPAVKVEEVKTPELTPEQKIAKYEEDRASAERRALAAEEHNRNLAKEHERLKAELVKNRKEMLVKTRPETLERIDGLEESIKHVIDSREVEAVPEQVKPAADDGIERFRAVVSLAHPDAFEYMKRQDVAARAAGFFAEVGDDWVNRPLDLIREITKLKVEDASKGSDVYKQEVDALKVKLSDMEKKVSRSAELSAMTAPAGGRSAPVSPASAGEENYIKSIQDMSHADFRDYADRVAAGHR